MDESAPAFGWAALFVGTRSEIRGGERSEVGQGLTRGREVAVLRGRQGAALAWPVRPLVVRGVAWRLGVAPGVGGRHVSGVRDALRAGWCGGLVGVCAA